MQGERQEVAQGWITVFGGSGFLGSRVVAALLRAGQPVRVVARHPDKAQLPGSEGGPLETVAADIRDELAVSRALEGARGAVNAVSLYREQGDLTFQAVHVDAARQAAELARQAGLQHFIHVSGIGVDARSPSAFVRARAEGETAVKAAYADATIIRPSVMFACGGGLVSSLDVASRAPIVPLFGRGNVRLQPAFVEDVAHAIARCMERPDSRGRCFELGGARIYRYREALELVARHLGRRRIYVPMPLAIWHPLVALMEKLPKPPLTRDQLFLLATDNVVAPGSAGFADLGITAESLESVLATCP